MELGTALNGDGQETLKFPSSERLTVNQEVILKRELIGLRQVGHRSMNDKSRFPKQRKHPKACGDATIKARSFG
jgi:hypothetical protein